MNMKKTCLLGGILSYDIIVVREYPDGFEVGKRNRFVEKIVKEEIGGTCGNVATMLPALGVQTFPIGHFDETEKGWKLVSDLERYGADTRFVRNSVTGGTTTIRCTHIRNPKTGEHDMLKPRIGNAANPSSRFPAYRHLRKVEVDTFMAKLDFEPDFYFFDTMDGAGLRELAHRLHAKGTMVFFEPENDKKPSILKDAVVASDIVKFSGARIKDLGFADGVDNKLFVQTNGGDGLMYKLRGGPWKHMDPEPCEKVVDWEGAGDWTSSMLIAGLAHRDVRRIADLDEATLRECLRHAQQVAAQSVGFIASKGILHVGKLNVNF